MNPRKPHYHRGSALVTLGFSIILFIISYGIMFTILPQILGMFYSAQDNMPIANSDWAEINTNTRGIVAYLVPLIPTIGIFVLVIKVLMVASTRGRD